MSSELLLLFVPACFALNMAPGPNNLLSVSNAGRFGFMAACLAGVGRLVAFVGMIAIAASGLAVVLQSSLLTFTAIRVGGALYLFYLAFQLWSARVERVQESGNNEPAQMCSLWRLARQEFLVAAGNPKAILIFTAFLPQFVNTAEAVMPQFFILGLLFLLLEWIAIAAYAYMGAYLGKWFALPARKLLFNRVCAVFLGSAGAGLLLSEDVASAT